MRGLMRTMVKTMTASAAIPQLGFSEEVYPPSPPPLAQCINFRYLFLSCTYTLFVCVGRDSMRRFEWTRCMRCEAS